jgi:peptidoglycan/xylan/chitin deacetylase (PgdA/CDA1 family)
MSNHAMIRSGLIFLIFSTGCQTPPDASKSPAKSDTIPAVVARQADSVSSLPPAVAPGIVLSRRQIPILCYHQIRDWKPTDSKRSMDYIVPPEAFRSQIKMLADSGYHSILPDQLYLYLTKGIPLPPKPVLLSFDDTDLDQYGVAFPTMKKYGYKGIFFIMTVSLGRKHYMDKAQVKELFDAGNIIGSHTWDHHNVKKYEGNDWLVQIDKPTRELESITGKPIRYFAFPFGLWNRQAIIELKKRGFIAAFQLNEKRDELDPLFTIRRIIVPGTWSLGTFNHALLHDF